jgi:serine/threonine protein kinase
MRIASQVFLARDEETGMIMAVKEILVEDESDLDVGAATKEVELLRYLRHDHVVKYLGSCVDADNKKLSIFTVRSASNGSLDSAP